MEFREVITAVRDRVQSGCGSQMLPIHLGAWQTVYGWFRERARRVLFQTIHDVALMLDREASPLARVIDSRSVRAAPIQKGLWDAGKTVVGRTLPVAVDIDGRLRMVNLTTSDGAGPGRSGRHPQTPAPGKAHLRRWLL